MFKKISVFTVALFVLISCASLALKMSHAEQMTGKTKVMNYPNLFGGVEPIKITDLGGYHFQARNDSRWTVRQFVLRFVAGMPGRPLHGDGGHQHTLDVQWGLSGKESLLPGASVEVSAEDNARIMGRDPEVDLSNTEVWIFEVRFEGNGQKWLMGKFLNRVTGGWSVNSELTPKPQARPRILTGRCKEYDTAHDFPMSLCSNTECPTCKYNIPQFINVSGGYPLIFTCAYCQTEFGSVCQKSNGFACVKFGVNDLDFQNPC